MQNFRSGLGGGQNNPGGESNNQQNNSNNNTQAQAGGGGANSQAVAEQQKLLAQLQLQNQQAALLEGLSNPSSYLASLQLLQAQQQHQTHHAAHASLTDNTFGAVNHHTAPPAGRLAMHLAELNDPSAAATAAAAGMGLAGLHQVAGNPLAPHLGGGNYIDSNRLLLRQVLQANNAAASVAAQHQQAAAQVQQHAGLWGAMGGMGATTARVDQYAERGILGPWSATSAGVLDRIARIDKEEGVKKKVVRRKPKDRPKRPLSAYNIFFKEERARILSEIPGETTAEEGEESNKDAAAAEGGGSKRKKSPHGKIGFESLAKAIGQRWKSLEPEKAEYYKEKAAEDMARYKEQMEVFLAKQAEKKKAEEAALKQEDKDDEGAGSADEASTNDESDRKIKGEESTTESQPKRKKDDDEQDEDCDDNVKRIKH